MSCDDREFFEDVEIFWEKQQNALKYLEDHNIPNLVDDILNFLAIKQPKYPITHIRDKFDEIIPKPTISKIELEKTYDSEFLPNFSINLYGQLNNDTKILESTKNCLSCYLENSLDSDNRSNEEENINYLIEKLENSVIPMINEKLINLRFTQQIEIDDILINFANCKIDEICCKIDDSHSKSSSWYSHESKSKKSQKSRNPSPKKKPRSLSVSISSKRNYLKFSNSIILAISQAICNIGAKIRKMNTIEYIQQTYNISKLKKFPIIIFSLVENIPNGKCRFVDEISLVFKSQNIHENIENFKEIMNYCYNSLFQKFNPQTKIFGKRGGLLVTIDKIDQITDLVNEASCKQELSITEDVDILISFHSNSIYDEISERYELQSGSYKTREEFISLLQELETKNYVSFFVDPLSQVDYDGWTKLLENLNEQTKIIKTFDFTKSEIFAIYQNDENTESKSRKIMPSLHYSGPNVVSNYTKIFNEFKDVPVMFSTPYGDSSSVFPLELAMAIGFDYIKVNVSSSTRSSYVEYLLKHFTKNY